MDLSFSGTLLRFIDFQKKISLEASTVSEALSKVANKYPKARPVLYDGDGRIRQVHQIFLNGKQLGPSELDTAVNPNDQLAVLTAIAGG